MPDRHPLALIVCLTVATIVSVGLLRAEDQATAATLREARGFTRGAFVDRYRRPLAVAGSDATRTYSGADLPTVIGYQDAQGQWHGLEKRFDAFLMGTTARKDWRTFFMHLAGNSVHGGTVQLTLDAAIQNVAARALGSAAGSVVALDPRTGGILAMVSSPQCAQSVGGHGSRAPLCRDKASGPGFNRATQLLLPPGSAFKIVTLTAAIDSGRFRLSSTFQGEDVFGPSPYFDNSAYPSNITRSDISQLTLAQALAFSDNFTFAHVGLTLGSRTLLRYAHRYYIGRAIPFGLPVAASRIADRLNHPSRAQLARSSFGAADDRVTPLQMALVAGAVANRGTLMAPHLVLSLRTAAGRVTYRYRPHVLSRVMRPSSARQVTQGMVFVVDHGSGFRAQIPGIQVAGKTGTAASGASRPHAWFIAFAPAQHPVVAVAVLHEFSGEGFKFAAPIARRVLVAGLREAGYKVR